MNDDEREACNKAWCWPAPYDPLVHVPYEKMEAFIDAWNASREYWRARMRREIAASLRNEPHNNVHTLHVLKLTADEIERGEHG